MTPPAGTTPGPKRLGVRTLGRVLPRATTVLLVSSAAATSLALILWRCEWAWIPIALVLVACAAFALALPSFDREVSAPALVVATLVLFTVAITVPPRTSSDLWSYASYGRIVTVHHESPYEVAPAELPADPISERVGAGWRSTPTVYGPAFTALSAALAPFAGDSPLRTRLLYQGLAAVAVLGAGLLLARRRSRGAAMLLVLNPAVGLYVVNGGHNDALTGVLLLVAVLAFARPMRAGVSAALAVAIKATGALGAAALVIGDRDRSHRRVLLLTFAACGLLVLSAYGAFGLHDALHALQTAGGRTSRASAWNIVRALGFAVGRENEARRLIQSWAQLIALGFAAVVLVRTRHRPPAERVAGVMVAYLLAAPYVLVWYVAGVLPVAAMVGRTLSGRVAVALALWLTVGYSVLHPPPTSAPAYGSLSTTATAVVLPIGMAVLLWVFARDLGRTGPESTDEGWSRPVQSTA